MDHVRNLCHRNGLRGLMSSFSPGEEAYDYRGVPRGHHPTCTWRRSCSNPPRPHPRLGTPAGSSTGGYMTVCGCTDPLVGRCPRRSERRSHTDGGVARTPTDGHWLSARRSGATSLESSRLWCGCRAWASARRSPVWIHAIETAWHGLEA